MISGHLLLSTFSAQQVLGKEKKKKNRLMEVRGVQRCCGRRSAAEINLSQVFHDDMF